MIVTDEMITAAADQVQAADAELQSAEHEALRGTGQLDDDAAAKLTLAGARHRQARVRLDRLRADADLQRAEMEARAATEAANGGQLILAERLLIDRRDELTRAATDAQDAMLRLMAAASAYTAAVEKQREAVLQIGLRLSDVDLAVEHATGAAELTGLRLRGTWWPQTDPTAVLARTVRAVIRATFGPGHLLGGRLAGWSGSGDLDPAGLLLADVPALPDPEPVVRWRAQREFEPSEKGDPGPFLLRAESRRLAGPGA